MIILLLAFLIGAVAGLRAFTAPTAVSWAAHLGWLSLGGGPLAFLGFAWAPWILTLLALVELVIDQLPSAPSRKAPGGFGARIVSGALSGAATGAPVGWLIVGGIAGIVGAVIGTLGGYAARAKLALAFRKYLPGRVYRGRDCDPHCDRHRIGAEMNRRFDAIIIGADQAGTPSAGRLTSAGMSVALMERHLFGGTCVNTGCPRQDHRCQRLRPVSHA